MSPDSNLNERACVQQLILFQREEMEIKKGVADPKYFHPWWWLPLGQEEGGVCFQANPEQMAELSTGAGFLRLSFLPIPLTFPASSRLFFICSPFLQVCLYNAWGREAHDHDSLK